MTISRKLQERFANARRVYVLTGAGISAEPGSFALAQKAGAFLVEINPEKTLLTGIRKESLQGKAGDFLPLLEL
ncbi:MAG: hypothetical protein M3209_10130 [Acidobacteriota bacterium]|nr:hypothetical protein [Acidobacteriota bacterium]